MKVNQIFEEDKSIARALIKRDEKITKQYFYIKCYPLFKSIYDNYYTDCETCLDFIHEMYVLLLTPGKKTGKCQMENFRGESTLTSWIKTSCLFFCYHKYEQKKNMPTSEPFRFVNDENGDSSDSFEEQFPSIDIDLSNLNRNDVDVILSMMPNKRYRDLIRLRFLEQKTDSETAESLGMVMSNYYNKKILAVKQFNATLAKEDKYGK